MDRLLSYTVLAIVACALAGALVLPAGAAGVASDVAWARTLGGNSYEELFGGSPTTDGGVIAAGYTYTYNNGDVTGYKGAGDYWVVKLNAAGGLDWQKCLGGYNGQDFASGVIQTSDGGYLVAGGAYSTDGDVTGNHGMNDLWLVKLNSVGSIVWQKAIGGSSNDGGGQMKQTPDGGYLVAGCTRSNDGDVTGNHGGSDLLVVKVDAAGNLVWLKTYGGSADEDGTAELTLTSDGGCIVTAFTKSGDGDVTGYHGGQDAWVVKLNAAGDLVWQRALGGSGEERPYAVQQTADGGYMVAGFTVSNDGDVSGNHGSQDAWLVKLNAAGELVWQRPYGGSGYEEFRDLRPLADGGYLMAGITHASTDGDVVGVNHGGWDYWVVRLDATGAIQWQILLGGSQSDYLNDMAMPAGGGSIMIGSVYSNDGDVSGYHGSLDGWVVALDAEASGSPPAALLNAYGTDEDTPLTVSAEEGVLVNDMDMDDDPLTAILVSQAAHGTVVLNADGSFTYTPAADFEGEDTFTYKANDGTFDSDPASVTIAVDAINDAPVAGDDPYSTDEDVPLVVPAPGILANDADVDGDPITFALVRDVAHGTLALNVDGSFSYAPGADWFGTDTFTYRLNDGTVDSNTATVTITVNSVNDAPVAAAESYATNEDTPLAVNTPGVLANDQDVSGDTLTARLVSTTANGALTLNADGSLAYAPNPNWFGTDSFTYAANDGAADSDTVTVEITVTPVNDVPVVADDSYTTDEDVPLVVAAPGIVGNDLDVDGNPLAISVIDDVDHGTLALSPDGAFTYTPAANWGGTDAFTYRVNDGSVDSNTATVTIVVNLVNEAATITAVTVPAGPNALRASVAMTGTFTDPDLGDTHTASWDWGDGSSGAGTVNDASGTVTGSHAYTKAGLFTVTLTITDAAGAAASMPAPLYVVVFDTKGGYVTGNGQILSPAGAYRANTAMTGPAAFGFLSQYKKGTTTPTGQTEFLFQVAGMRFYSNQYDWLVVAGARAQYKGTGTVNGAGSYGFMLTAIDGQVSGGGGVDKFRIKIWDTVTDSIVYDNQFGVADDGEPTTALTKGSIEIRKK